MLHEGGGVFQKPLQKVSFLAVYYCTTPDWVCEFVATIAHVSVVKLQLLEFEFFSCLTAGALPETCVFSCSSNIT